MYRVPETFHQMYDPAITHSHGRHVHIVNVCLDIFDLANTIPLKHIISSIIKSSQRFFHKQLSFQDQNQPSGEQFVKNV